MFLFYLFIIFLFDCFLQMQLRYIFLFLLFFSLITFCSFPFIFSLSFVSPFVFSFPSFFYSLSPFIPKPIFISHSKQVLFHKEHVKLIYNEDNDLLFVSFSILS